MPGLSRQDSASSASSGASGMSAASSMAAAGDGVGGAAGGDIEEQSALQTAVFGTLLTLYQERWEESKRFLVGRVLLEHLQLLLLVLQTRFLWTFDTSHWLWEILNYLLLKNLTVPGGYVAYSAVLYIMVALVAASIAACGWLSYHFYKNGSVPNKWPVKLLRLFMMVFFKVFYITVLNYLLGPLDCRWLAKAKTFYNEDFPSKDCTSMPHMAVEFVAAVAGVLVIVTAGLMSLTEGTQNPVNQNWLAAAHSGVEFKTWLFKTVIVIATNVLSGFSEAQDMIIMIAAGWIVYVHVRYQPYLFEWMNHIRTGLYGMPAMVSLLMTIDTFAQTEAGEAGMSVAQLLVYQADTAQALTSTMFALLPVAFVGGVALSWLRLHLWVAPVLKKFRQLSIEQLVSTNQSLKDMHKFYDEYEVELVARCCRRWDDYEDAILNQEAVQLADHIIKAGLARFPNSAHMVLIYINYLCNVQNNMQSCNSQLQVARKLQCNWLDSYVFFVQEQLVLLRSHTDQSTDAAVDLVGYVEFQRNFKTVLRAHKAALFAYRAFWKQLLHNQVPFTGIVRAFRRIEACRKTADRTYQAMLERYPSNIKMLRAYARFVEDVCNDPWAASKFYSEADRLEELEGGDMGDLGQNDDPLRSVEAKSAAVCVINSMGVIQLVNKPLLKMFGYRKGEVEGKNVSMLMPQPFSGKHNSFLRNYALTGKTKILNTLREVVGLHKDRFVFPINLTVTKVSGSGTEAIFMGVIQPCPDRPNVVKAWIMPEGGMMMCMDQRFADWFGLTPAECLGRPFSALCVDPDIISGLLETADAATSDQMEADLVTAKDVALYHKFADPQRVDITMHMGGSEDQRLYVALISRRADQQNEHLMVTDRKGRIMYITSKLALLLGFPNPKALIKHDFTSFMAQPFMQLHGRWMKDIPRKVPLCSCRNSAPVVLITQQRTPVPATLEIVTREQREDDEVLFAVKVNPITFTEALNSRRVSLRIDAHGDILEVSDTPHFVFGFTVSRLLGRNLSECLDVFGGLPATHGAESLDMEHVITELVHKTAKQQDSSWRCGLHPPMTAEDLAAAQSNILQANMVRDQTKPALLQLEIEGVDEEHGGVTSITAHVWRAEMLTGVVEVDRDALVVKAGCCPLHQPGPIFGMPSSALMHTKLSQWLNVSATYDGLLVDGKRKGGALKKKAADVKIGPLFHATGQHFDGGLVKVAVQAVMKEGPASGGRLVVKLTVENPTKGNPNLARRLLGLPDLAEAGALFSSPGGEVIAEDTEPQGDDADGAGAKSMKHRDGVRFGEHAEEGSEDDLPRQAQDGKGDRLMEWVKQASGTGAPTADDDNNDALAGAEESLATIGLPLPPADKGAEGFDYAAPPDANFMGMGEEAASQATGDDTSVSASETGVYQSDFKRGKRLRKLTHMLSSKSSQKFTLRFYNRTVSVIALLVAAHLACFTASVVLLGAQKQFIDEVDDAGTACIAMHRMAIDCRVLDAVYRRVTREGIFTEEDMEHFIELFDNAITQFETAHEDTYLGRGNLMRRFINRQKYKLQDYWETPSWSAKLLLNTTPPMFITRNMSLWAMGNQVITSAREVLQNHKQMVANGDHLDDNPFWYFVMENSPESLYVGYKTTLYGLVERATNKIADVHNVMAILMVLEGCVLSCICTVYVCALVQKTVSQRADLFNVFLVIPTGFLRALASKQVQLDEDGDSDDGSEIGDIQPADAGQPQQEEKQGTQKLNLSLGGKKAKGQGGAGPAGGRGKQLQHGLLDKLTRALNPMTWFAQRSNLESGKRQLLRNGKDILWIGVPFAMWGGLIILIYAISMQQLTEVQSPFQMLNIINFLVFRITRTVLYTLEACMAAPDLDRVAVRLGEVTVRLQNLLEEYTSFLYGFHALGKNAIRSDLSSDSAALFENADLAAIFFRTNECMRKNQATCYVEEHPFYTSTHNGLDAMVNRFAEEVRQLTAHKPLQVDITNEHLEYIWQVGRADLFDGMTKADEIFRGHVQGLFDQVRLGHTIVFAISIVGALMMWLVIVRPMLKRIAKESRQIAEMLSQLPPDVDVEGLVGQVLAEAAAEEDGHEQKASNAAGLKEPGAGSRNGCSSNKNNRGDAAPTEASSEMSGRER